MKKKHLQKHLNKNFGGESGPLFSNCKIWNVIFLLFFGGLLHLQDDLLLGLASVRSLGVLKVLVLGFKKAIWLHSQKLTANAPENRPKHPKGKDRIPTIHFQGTVAVSYRDSIFLNFGNRRHH